MGVNKLCAPEEWLVPVLLGAPAELQIFITSSICLYEHIPAKFVFLVNDMFMPKYILYYVSIKWLNVTAPSFI